jgi:hypothetical protein
MSAAAAVSFLEKNSQAASMDCFLVASEESNPILIRIRLIIILVARSVTVRRSRLARNRCHLGSDFAGTGIETSPSPEATEMRRGFDSECSSTDERQA